MIWIEYLLQAGVLVCIFGFGLFVGLLLGKKRVTIITDEELAHTLAELLRK